MKIGIVTGASSGIGREFVYALDKAFSLDEIWVIARREGRLQELQEQCETKIRPLPLDLSESKSFEKYQELLQTEKPEIQVLSNQSSETLVFSRKIGILILVPYVFSLVFALMSRNKGNFLFRLPRPPYQAVLRKFVSLPS